MNLMMNIHVRACINELEWQIHRLEQELHGKELLMEKCASEPQVAQTRRVDIQQSDSQALFADERVTMLQLRLFTDT